MLLIVISKYSSPNSNLGKASSLPPSLTHSPKNRALMKCNLIKKKKINKNEKEKTTLLR